MASVQGTTDTSLSKFAIAASNGDIPFLRLALEVHLTIYEYSVQERDLVCMSDMSGRSTYPRENQGRLSEMQSVDSRYKIATNRLRPYYPSSDERHDCTSGWNISPERLSAIGPAIVHIAGSNIK